MLQSIFGNVQHNEVTIVGNKGAIAIKDNIVPNTITETGNCPE